MLNLSWRPQNTATHSEHDFCSTLLMAKSGTFELFKPIASTRIAGCKTHTMSSSRETRRCQLARLTHACDSHCQWARCAAAVYSAGLCLMRASVGTIRACLLSWMGGEATPDAPMTPGRLAGNGGPVSPPGLGIALSKILRPLADGLPCWRCPPCVCESKSRFKSNFFWRLLHSKGQQCRC